MRMRARRDWTTSSLPFARARRRAMVIASFCVTGGTSDERLPSSLMEKPSLLRTTQTLGPFFFLYIVHSRVGGGCYAAAVTGAGAGVGVIADAAAGAAGADVAGAAGVAGVTGVVVVAGAVFCGRRMRS